MYFIAQSDMLYTAQSRPHYKQMFQINWETAQEYYSLQVNRGWKCEENQKKGKIT
jgi:hypothetical protein